MTIALITPPASEPLSIAEMKTHLRIDHDHEDDLLLELLRAARQYTEFASGQKLLTQLWRQYVSGISQDRCVTLKVAPVQSISAVIAYDAEGEPSPLSLDEFDLVRGTEPVQLRFSDGVNMGRAANGLEIDIIAGLTDLAVEVPDTLKHAIRLLVAHWYEFRGAISPQQQPVSLPPGFDSLVRAYRPVRLA